MDTYSNFGDTVLLRDRVYKVLKMEILLGRIKPGEKLNILDLSTKFNISLAPIREALNILSKEGLVDLSPHKKPVVAVGCLDDFYISVDMRKLLEPYAARLCVNCIPQEAIDSTRKLLLEILANPTDMSAYVESDMLVHELLHVHANSKVLSGCIETVKIYTMRFRYLVEKNPDFSNASISDYITMSTKEHMDIIDALDTRDPDKAYDAVLRHITLYAERNAPTS